MGGAGGANQPRSELRHYCNPEEGGQYNWKVTKGKYRITGTYSIGDVDDPEVTDFVIQQIHGYPWGALLKYKWQNGKLYANVKTDSKGKTKVEYEMGDAPQFETFELKTVVDNGYLKGYLNGKKKYEINIGKFWPYDNYFKTGCYLGSTKKKAFAHVFVYDLSVKIGGECIEHDGKKFEFDDSEHDTTESKPDMVVIGIVAVVMVVIACIVIVGIYRYIRPRNRTKVGFEDKEKVQIGDESDDEGEEIEMEMEVEIEQNQTNTL